MWCCWFAPECFGKALSLTWPCVGTVVVYFRLDFTTPGFLSGVSGLTGLIFISQWTYNLYTVSVRGVRAAFSPRQQPSFLGSVWGWILHWAVTASIIYQGCFSLPFPLLVLGTVRNKSVKLLTLSAFSVGPGLICCSRHWKAHNGHWIYWDDHPQWGSQQEGEALRVSGKGVVFVHSLFPLPHSDIARTKQMLFCLMNSCPLICFLQCHKCKKAKNKTRIVYSGCFQSISMFNKPHSSLAR